MSTVIEPRETFYAGDADGTVMKFTHAGRMRRVAAGWLDPRHDISAKSSAGFGWGEPSARTQQLALALLADVIGDQRIAIALMRPFASLVLEHLPAGQPWMMSASVVRALAASLGDVSRSETREAAA